MPNYKGLLRRMLSVRAALVGLLIAALLIVVVAAGLRTALAGPPLHPAEPPAQSQAPNAPAAAGTIPTATWDPNSTCEIIGYTTGGPPTGLGQSFGNFTWNATNQGTTNINLAGTLTTVNGNFTVLSTGTTGSLRLESSAVTL